MCPHQARRAQHCISEARDDVLAIIAPELIVFFAARQFFFARSFSKRLVSRGPMVLLCMGGFVSADGLYPVSTLEQLADPLLGDRYLADIRAVDSEIIMDKSKGDALSKGVALLQSCWFITQCVARGLQRLPLTEIEVATVAFAAVNVITWILWFRKPLAVQFPIPIGPSSVPGDRSPSVAKASSKRILFSITNAIYGSEATTSLLDRGSHAMEPSYAESFLHSFLLEVTVAVIFGAIHCTAWDANFPSATEKWLWRLSALTIAVIPALMGLVQLRGPQASEIGIIEVSFLATMVVYIVSRLLLIILPFTTLRRIPMAALVTSIGAQTYRIFEFNFTSLGTDSLFLRIFLPFSVIQAYSWDCM
ncbi:hypothetical protein B0H13DRAFT_2494093 [Mycena leptocephala]|nr:hypothetical protein B0H13DRAFT_2494093 [Mycena leptocephala]